MSSTVVWAKMRYCSYWPARMVDKPPEGMKGQPKKCCVYFFGTRNYGFVDIKNVLSYVQHREKFSSKGRGNFFKEAVTACDEFISNPIESNESEMRDEVLVKTELDFEIKKENPNGLMCDSEIVKIAANHESSSSHQILCQSCDDKNRRIAVLSFEMECLISERNSKQMQYSEETNSWQAKIGYLKNENEQLKNKFHFMQTQHDVDLKRIIALNEQVDVLQNRLEQLKSKIDLEFEVEKLLKHKKEKDGIEYLVRWKGYDKEYDSWVKEKNLNCAQKLVSYKKSKKLM